MSSGEEKFLSVSYVVRKVSRFSPPKPPHNEKGKRKAWGKWSRKKAYFINQNGLTLGDPPKEKREQSRTCRASWKSRRKKKGGRKGESKPLDRAKLLSALKLDLPPPSQTGQARQAPGEGHRRTKKGKVLTTENERPAHKTTRGRRP